jgi:hypothetical protein
MRFVLVFYSNHIKLRDTKVTLVLIHSKVRRKKKKKNF